METENKQKEGGKTLRGIIVSDKMKNSAVVLVERYVKHPKYGKYTRQQKKYTVHNPDNVHKVGEKVAIQETKPISKTKRFKIVK